ncbi:hypothetical protein Desca_1423 [Desulfotomaculum nigrificans CO-1-SRB]|uniref:Uncharacterized protein n=1 Tax=Desulfotomaculum nigrificans (strain DSM 14880 / VKM B-2319 / CO-1-SRB) TaxID=868595 RepID=F6B5F8_DESCC|nr:hypothetical protein [Desulfotomaculum nigrificans]AEF94279.1 hypothetical protein Desca_1423 [Desulfotomaculum nigrificans CO-1-SRB]
MHKDNITCIQRARFFFYFYEKKEWLPGEEPPLDNIIKVKNVEPQAVRKLGQFLSNRLERIATMMEILTSAHDDWAITGKKDMILMETETFDFNDALKILKDHGFNDDEFILKVEYNRKWGIL